MPLRVWLLDPNSHTLPYDRALAGALAAAGCRVELIASPFLYEHEAGWRPAADFQCTYRFFALAAGPLAPRLGLDRRPRARRLLKAAEYPLDWLLLLARLSQRPPDILHVQWSLAPDLDRWLWRYVQRRGVPIVYTAHNLVPHRRSAGDEERYRRLYAAADAIVVHTERTAAELATRFAVPRDRLHVAPHGPLLADEPALARAAARQRLGLPPAAPLVLFTGLIEPYKGLADLVAAFDRVAAAHPTAHLIVAGRPNAPVDGECQALAAAGLADRARFDLRYLPRSELAAYLCAADVVVLPYRETTSSGLLMAAWRFACPVVATAVGDLAALIDDGASGLLAPPADPPALAAAISRLLADPALAARLGSAGQRVAMTEQSWSVAAARTLTAYQSVLLAGRGGWARSPIRPAAGVAPRGREIE